MATANRILGATTSTSRHSSIDRKSVVQRHNPTIRKIDPFSALSVGNGEFAFTADVTGLQTFLDPYDKDFPLCTTSHWAWHSVPIASGLDPKDFRYVMFDTYGREVPYATSNKGQEALFNWLRENPHRLHLGRIGLELTRADGSPASPEDIQNIDQTLDLWSGLLVSKFEFDGSSVRVQTCCHPTSDMIAVRIESPLIAKKQLKLFIAFPYGTHNMNMAIWDAPNKHQTSAATSKNRVDFARSLDTTRYNATLAWSGDGEFSQRLRMNRADRQRRSNRIDDGVFVLADYR